MGITPLRARARLLVVTLVVLVLLPSSGESGSRPSLKASSAADGERRIVWVALEDAHAIARVDVDERKVLLRKSVPGAPHNLTISPSGETIATTLWSAGRVVLRRDGKQKAVFLGGSPHDVKIGGGRVVVANQTEARLDILSTRGQFRKSIALKADPHDLALRWRGRQAWVTLEGSDDMAVVGIKKSRVRYVSTGRAPHDLLFAPDGKLWVSDWHGAIHVFSKKGRKIKTIPLGVEAHHLDFTPDGDQVWITDHAVHRVFVVKTDNYRVRKRFRVGGAPHHVAITPDGDRAVVVDHDRGLAIVYNVRKLKWNTKFRIGAGPHGIWAVP